MGLDIYLNTRDRHEADQQYFEAEKNVYDRPDWGSLSDGEKQALEATIPPYQSHEIVPSRQYPEHFFNRRYLRSSYNNGGFNRAVPDMTGQDHDLYWIFEPLDRDLESGDINLTRDDIGKLKECSKRAEQVASEIDHCDALRVTEATMHLGEASHMWAAPPNDNQVLEWYRNERDKPRAPDDDGGYSNAKGLVVGFKKGMEVLAVTLGQNCLGRPCAYLVYRLDQESIDYYRQSAEITAEFCDEAIELIKRDGTAHIMWSG